MNAIIGDAWDKMDHEQRVHFKHLCAALLPAYVVPEATALVLIGQMTSEGVHVPTMISMNALDQTVLEMINCAHNEFMEQVMADAPPREMYS